MQDKHHLKRRSSYFKVTRLEIRRLYLINVRMLSTYSVRFLITSSLFAVGWVGRKQIRKKQILTLQFLADIFPPFPNNCPWVSEVALTVLF